MIWGALHGLTYLDHRADMTVVMHAISRWLPCPTCRHHVQTYMHTTPRTSSWFQYLVDLHNAVNVRTSRPVMSSELVRLKYDAVRDHLHFDRTVRDRAWEMIWILIASYDLQTVGDRPTRLEGSADGLKALVNWMGYDYRLPRTQPSLLMSWSHQLLCSEVEPLRWFYLRTMRYPHIYTHMRDHHFLAVILDLVGIYDACRLVQLNAIQRRILLNMAESRRTHRNATTA